MVVIAVCNALIVSNHAGYEYYDAPAWCTATKQEDSSECVSYMCKRCSLVYMCALPVYMLLATCKYLECTKD